MIELQTEYCVGSIVDEAPMKYHKDDITINNSSDIEYTVEFPLTTTSGTDFEDYILHNSMNDICLSSGLPALECVIEGDETLISPSSNCEDGDEIHHSRIVSDEAIPNDTLPSLPQPSTTNNNSSRNGNGNGNGSPVEFQIQIFHQDDEKSLVSSAQSFSESLQHVYPNHDDSSTSPSLLSLSTSSSSSSLSLSFTSRSEPEGPKTSTRLIRVSSTRLSSSSPPSQRNSLSPEVSPLKRQDATRSLIRQRSGEATFPPRSDSIVNGSSSRRLSTNGVSRRLSSSRRVNSQRRRSSSRRNSNVSISNSQHEKNRPGSRRGLYSTRELDDMVRSARQLQKSMSTGAIIHPSEIFLKKKLHNNKAQWHIMNNKKNDRTVEEVLNEAKKRAFGKARKPRKVYLKRFDDGRVYRGELTMYNETTNSQRGGATGTSVPHGHGKMTYPDGSVYAGKWERGVHHGQGRCLFADGSFFKGEFHMGAYQGQGIMIWSDGGYYLGNWHQNEMHGYGMEVLPDGSLRHEGEWNNGYPAEHDEESDSGYYDEDFSDEESEDESVDDRHDHCDGYGNEELHMLPPPPLLEAS